MNDKEKNTTPILNFRFRSQTEYDQNCPLYLAE